MGTSEESDEALLIQFRQSGAQECLGHLFQRHLGKVRGMIYAMTLNEADADDVTQEVFLRAARGLPGFRGGARFSTWLYRIAMNTTRNFLAQRTTAARRRGEALLEDCVAPGGGQPDRVTVGKEMQDQIHRAISRLTPPLRAAVTLTILHDLSPREAARIEGCATATMYWRVHQARQLLREQLMDQAPE